MCTICWRVLADEEFSLSAVAHSLHLYQEHIMKYEKVQISTNSIQVLNEYN